MHVDKQTDREIAYMYTISKCNIFSMFSYIKFNCSVVKDGCVLFH